MEERGSVNKTIIDSDAFLDMPISAQALYFHLAIRADDDGIIQNPKALIRALGVAECDLELLCKKQFVCRKNGWLFVLHARKHNSISNRKGGV